MTDWPDQPDRDDDRDDRREEGADPTEPVVRDRRRIDPQTGELRQPASPAAPAAGGAPAAGAPQEPVDPFDAAVAAELGDDRLALEVERAQAESRERLEDLRRLQAEYVNYRRRVERDRDVVRDTAVAGALATLLPVLDDIGRARDHGDLTGAFKAVGEGLEQAVAKLGLERYGEEGEPFDPAWHEALMHEYADDVTEPTCVRILMPGYRFSDRVVRPARVAVAEPTAALPDGTDSTA